MKPFKDMVVRCLFFLTCIAASLTSHGQTYSYRNYTSESGLTSSNVYVAFQDSKGYIWFATDEGVSRFDGKHFTNYTTQEGLGDNDILRIYEDTYGRVWFLPYNGHLSYFSITDNKIHNEKTNPHLLQAFPGSAIYYAMQDAKGRVWFCTLTGKIVQLDSTKATVFTLPGNSVPYIVCADQDQHGRVIVYHLSDRLVFDENTRSFKKEGPAYEPISTYFRAPSSVIYFSSSTHLMSITKGQLKKLFAFKDHIFQNDEIITTTDDGNYLYLATRENEVFALDMKNNFKVVKKYHFKSSVLSVTIDKEKNIWFLTRGSGAYMLPYQNRNTELIPSESFNNNDLYSIVQTDSNSFLIGGNQNNLFSLKNYSTNEISLSQNKLTARIVQILCDSSKNVWVGSETGMYKLIQNNHSTFSKANRIEHDNFLVRVLNIAISSTNTVTYAITTGIREIVPLPNQKFISKIPYNGIFENKRTYSVFYDNRNCLYVANIDGLNEVRKDSIIKYEWFNKQLHTRIVHISQTTDSTLVLSTDGNGIIFFKNGKIINFFNSKNGLVSPICRKTICKGNNIYVCTNKGLTSFTYANNNFSTVRTITNFNGLVSNDVRDILILVSKLYVVTTKGLCLLSSNDIPAMQSPPPVYITSIIGKNNREVNPNSIKLHYTENFLKVKFTAITFSNPADVTYQYSFGNDKGWIDSGNDEIAFSDLPPGDYLLSVRAKKINSTWSAPATIRFSIIPPFYKTWWFALVIVTACVLLVSMLFIFLYRRNQRALRIEFDKKNALNFERNRISADMHDDVGSDLSKIYVTTEFIKTQLGDQHTLYSQLQKLNGFANGARKKMDDIIWALNPKNDNLGNLAAYVNTYGLEYFSDTPIAFHLQNHIDDFNLQLNAKERRNIFLIIKELCANTLKHSQAQNFSILFKLESSAIIILTQDDGVGINSESINVFGNGMANMKKRTTEINGTFSVDNTLTKGIGFTITIPIR